MSCSNCFNGCAEIVSDQCVRYTGIDVPVLGIKTGDSLSYVEQALIEFLTSTLNGEGIKLNINPQIICEIVSKNLVTCEDLTLPNVISAIIKGMLCVVVEVVTIYFIVELSLCIETISICVFDCIHRNNIIWGSTNKDTITGIIYNSVF